MSWAACGLANGDRAIKKEAYHKKELGVKERERKRMKLIIWMGLLPEASPGHGHE